MKLDVWVSANLRQKSHSYFALKEMVNAKTNSADCKIMSFSMENWCSNALHNWRLQIKRGVDSESEVRCTGFSKSKAKKSLLFRS